MAGHGERIPLRDASVDVAWLSTVLHHLRDPNACARELRRLLTDGGVVLIRGALADRGFIPALEFFPGAERAMSSFPTLAATRNHFESAGFQLVDVLEVDDMGPRTVASVLQWVGIVRHADSLLARFTEDELARAIEAMKARDPDELLPGSTLALVVFRPQPHTMRGGSARQAHGAHWPSTARSAPRPNPLEQLVGTGHAGERHGEPPLREAC